MLSKTTNELVERRETERTIRKYRKDHLVQGKLHYSHIDYGLKKKKKGEVSNQNGYGV